MGQQEEGLAGQQGTPMGGFWPQTRWGLNRAVSYTGADSKLHELVDHPGRSGPESELSTSIQSFCWV
jgi:hypothetical protein